jgi:endonuclease/exonuclease/phosphatase family metal-dependent hydrolase
MQVLYRRTRLRPPLRKTPTFPSWAPERSLDHILTAGFECIDYRALPAAGSDHLAVAVTLNN